MRLSRFFVTLPLSLGSHSLPEATAHYISRVLRLSEGAAVQLFDGSGREFLGHLSQINKKHVQVVLTQELLGVPESPLDIHLGQGLSRGERMDWVIQKATELGVAQITPLFTERSEVRLNPERTEKRLAHWQQIAISACEQCGRSRLPQINAPQPVTQWLSAQQAEVRLVLQPATQPLELTTSPCSLALLVGPEGGLSEMEIAQAQALHFQAWQLGPRILRTETAPVAALAIAQHLWGDA